MNLTHYMINESSTPPSTSEAGWTPIGPSKSISLSGITHSLSAGEGKKTVYAWVRDDAGHVNEAGAGSHFDVTVDKTAPAITLSAPTNWTKINVPVSAVVSDALSGVSVKKWAAGKQPASFFSTGGGIIQPSETGFAVSADDWYTVYAKDRAGNEAVNHINIANIDSIAPTGSSIAAINNNGNVEAFWIEPDGVRHIRKTGTAAWSVNNLGGSIMQISAARNNDGTLELFAIGTNNKFYTNRQAGLYSDSWNGWVNRGGQRMKDICVARNSDGRLEVFGIGSHGLTVPYHQWQGEANKDETWNNSWSKLSDINSTRGAAAINSDGRLELFYLAGTVRHQWQENPHAGPWSGSSDMDARYVFNDISAVCNADGRLEIFGVDRSNRLYNKWQTKPHSGPWSGWSDKICGKGKVKQIHATCNADGRLELFAIGMNDFLYNIWQTKPSSGPWSDWNCLSDRVKIKNISATRNFDGRLEVFAIGTDSQIYHMWQTLPHSGPWSGWEQLPKNG